MGLTIRHLLAVRNCDMGAVDLAPDSRGLVATGLATMPAAMALRVSHGQRDKLYFFLLALNPDLMLLETSSTNSLVLVGIKWPGGSKA